MREVVGVNKYSDSEEGEFPVDSWTADDGSAGFSTATSCGGLQMRAAVGPNGISLRIVGTSELMSARVHEGKPFEGCNGKSETMRECIVELSDDVLLGTSHHFEQTGRVVAEMLKQLASAMERALSEQKK